MKNDSDQTNQPSGLPASDWVKLFEKAGIEREKLEVAKSKQAKRTIAGNWLSRNIDHRIEFESDGSTVRATLRAREGRSRKKLYYFEFHRDECPAESTGPTSTTEVPEQSEPSPPKERGDKKKARRHTSAAKRSPAKTTKTPSGRSSAEGNDESW